MEAPKWMHFLWICSYRPRRSAGFSGRSTTLAICTGKRACSPGLGSEGQQCHQCFGGGLVPQFLSFCNSPFSILMTPPSFWSKVGVWVIVIGPFFSLIQRYGALLRIREKKDNVQLYRYCLKISWNIFLMQPIFVLMCRPNLFLLLERP